MGKRATNDTGWSLASIPAEDIRMELLRREQKLRLAQRERVRLQAQIQKINSQIASLRTGPIQGPTVAPKGGAAIAHVVRVVAEEYGVTPADILSDRRFRSVARARQICMYLARQVCGCVLTDIGLALGGRDHSTTIHGIEQVQMRAAQSAEFAATLAALAARVKMRGGMP